MADLTSEAIAGFRERFGGEPAGVWSAPGRVNLIGEHTDYNDGFVLPFAIDRRTHVALRLRGGGRIRLGSALDDRNVESDVRRLGGRTDGWSAYPLGTAWALGRLGAEATGFDAYFCSDVPVGAGLSSSAAIECALAIGLDELWESDLDRDALVTATHLAENEVVGAPTGILDQSASLHCRADAALFLDCRHRSHETVPLGLDASGLAVLVVDTRVQHSHADGAYAARRAACERAATALGVSSLRDVEAGDLPTAEERLDEETFRRVRHVVSENDRVLAVVDALRTDGPRAIDDLLVASHVSMRDDYEISVPELDTAVEAALAAGAVGARMTGGGFGGCAIALIDRAEADRVGADVRSAFAARGFCEPATFCVRPSDGAARDT